MGEIWARCRREVGEIWARSGRDVGEIWARAGGAGRLLEHVRGHGAPRGVRPAQLLDRGLGERPSVGHETVERGGGGGVLGGDEAAQGLGLGLGLDVSLGLGLDEAAQP